MKSSRMYNYLGEYKLPFDITIEVVTEEDSKYVIVHAPKFYMEKHKKLNPSYGLGFTDQEIITDQTPHIMHLYGLKYHTYLGSA